MGIAADMLASWRHPRRIMQRRLDEGVREDRALIYLIAGCGLIFVAQWPRLAGLALRDPSTPLNARLGGALLAWLFIMPLVLYAVAALSHLLARALGGRGSWFSARLALFWALLAATPAWLANALVVGLGLPWAVQSVFGVVALGGFVLIWGASLYQAEKPGAPS